MDVSGEVRKMENRVRGAGRTVGELCRVAGIGRSTWAAWKNGRPPMMATWERARSAVDALVEAAG